MGKLLLLTATLLSTIGFGYKFDKDVPESIQTQVKTDLVFMGNLAGAQNSKLHQDIFGNLQGKNYVDFFESRVTAIGMNSCGNPNAVACVIPFLDASKIWFTQNYVKFSHPQIAKMMVVFHEARHTESKNGNWHHATCPTPFKDQDGKDMASIWTGAKLEGQPACDETELGSYSSSLILLKNVSKFCTNCTDKVKMDAGIYADDQFKRVIAADAIAKIKADLYTTIQQ